MSTTTQPGMATTEERFETEEFTGEVSARAGLTDLAGAVARLTRPSATSETLHWGRNYLYAARLHASGGPIDVVVRFSATSEGLLST